VRSVRSRVILVLIGCAGLIAGGANFSVAAKNDACQVSCKAEKRACRDAYRAAFQTSKTNCTGSGKAKRQCVNAAHSLLRGALRACRGFTATCLDCCKAAGNGCNVQCGDGIVSAGEGCDPPGSSGCTGGGACNESCQCPSTVTTTSLPTVTTSAPSTTTSTTTSTTQPSPCSNGIKDGNETATDCGGGTCAPCADGLACTIGNDCRSRFCSGDVCADPCPTEAAGTPCADDGNACTVDTCDGSTCQHAPADAGTICRPAVGLCDAAEECDGSGAPCPTDQLLSVGEVCRSIHGGCDEEEMCNGSSPECPSDAFTRAGATCRVSRGVCDRVETCSGTSAECPTDGFLGSETACRAAVGVCDVAETCSGSSKDCPDDGFQIGTVCRASAGVCDVAETCVGDPDCPPDAHSTAVCRPGPGPCDQPETCDGVHNDCPPDVVRPAGTVCYPTPEDSCAASLTCNGVTTACSGFLSPKPGGVVCRPPVGPCDAAEVCDGQSFYCPLDVLVPKNTLCRAEAGVCDVNEYCTGFGPQCPPDQKNHFLVCREAVTAMDGTTCDEPEVCDGVHDDCPPDGVQPQGNVCRQSTGLNGPGTVGHPCDAPETCDGQTNICPANQLLPLGTVCGDQTECRDARTCKGVCGGVVGGAACTSNANCAAGVQCLPFVGKVYICASPAINENGACDGGKGVCKSGTCTSRNKKFGETCDGDDAFVNGNPDQRFCGDDPNYKDLVCCAGSGLAKAGATGTCRECCNDERELQGGCPEQLYNTQECCDGVCKDLGFDPDNCGACGKKCSRYVTECTDPNVPLTCGKVEERCGPLGCSDFVIPGSCFMESVCEEGKYCLPEVTQAFADEVNAAGCESNWKQCFNWARSDPLDPCLPRLGGELSGVECPLTAQPLSCNTPLPKGHCGSCGSDADCGDPDECLDACGLAEYTLGGSSSTGFDCIGAPGICARDYEECR